MLGNVLSLVGSVVIVAWGIAHIVPTRPVVDGLGDLMPDGRRIATMGWVAEGLTLSRQVGQAVQVGGPVVRIDAARLSEAKQASKAIRDLFVRYADCLLAQVLQSVACNAAHTIERRCLRWLLTRQDRLGTPDLPVSREILADMLGCAAPTLRKCSGAYIGRV